MSPHVRRIRSLARRAPHAVVRRALRAYVRSAEPSRPRGDGPVAILLMGAYGMGGTIRATINIAGHVAQTRPVTIVSVSRRRSRPFFGAFPSGVEVVTMWDRRKSVQRTRLERFLVRFPSVLVHEEDRGAGRFSNLWSDVQIARFLRGGSGVLMGTKPGLSMVGTLLEPPGWALVGQDQMHLLAHTKGVRAAVKAQYPKLDALAVLTTRDAENYRELLGKRMPRVEILPNTARPLGGPKPDLAIKEVLAAGRFVPQKGFDLLIPAWAQVKARRPDWKLRVCGTGRDRQLLERLISEHDLADVVRLEPPIKNMGRAMGEASIFCLSSRYEGFPLILLEAMSKGMGVVAYDCPTGPADVIVNRQNGIIVPPEDVDALAAGLLELIEDDELRARCAAAAPVTAKDYTMDAVGPRWTALFDSVGPTTLPAPLPASRNGDTDSDGAPLARTPARADGAGHR